MFLIRRMSFSAFFLPTLRRNFREIYVGFGSSTVYLCQAEFVGKRKCLPVDACTADYLYMFLFFAALQSRFKRREHFCTGTFRSRIRRQYNVSAIGQRAFRKRFESLAPHYNCVSGSQRLETLQGVGQPEKKFILKAYCHTLVYGGDNGYFTHKNYTATAPAICGCGS